MILQVAGLNKSFRHPWNLQQIKVLHDVSFNIEKQSIVGFLGGNGAGKTTTIKCLLGLLKHQSGEITFFNNLKMGHQVQSQIGYLPERPFFYSYLTAIEFLNFYGELSGMKSKVDRLKRIDFLLDLVGLSHAKKMFLNQFSKGMLQRIGMAQALIHQPKLLILDEPLSGLDPDGRRHMVNIIQNTFDEEKTTIFFSSHLLDDVDRLCQQLVLIKKGQVRYCGSKSDFVHLGQQQHQLNYETGGEIIKKIVPNLDQLQFEIDKIRNQGFKIVSIEQETRSLDQAFNNFQISEDSP